MAGPVLEMRSIGKTFPGVKALSGRQPDASRRGEVHAICGENGAGKSTLMKVLSGVHPHGSYEGEILFRGRAVRLQGHPGERAARHRHHPPGARPGAVPVHRREHLPRQRARHPRGHQLERDPAARHGAAAAGGAATSTRRPGSPTSAWASSSSWRSPRRCPRRCELLILDEPTAALNDEDSSKLLDLILELKEQGITCIIISHKLNEIARSPTPSPSCGTAGPSRPSTSKASPRSPRTASSAAWSAATSTTASPTRTAHAEAGALRPSRSGTGPCSTRSTSSARSSTTCP